MKVYANRYGMIESHELAFALQAEKERRKDAEEASRVRSARRAARRQRLARAVDAAVRLLGALREGALRVAAGRA
jgi:hypothetical protein